MAELLRGEIGRLRLVSVLQLIEGESLDAALVLGGSSVVFRFGQVVEAHHPDPAGGAAPAALAVLEQFWYRGPFVLEAREGAGSPEPVAPIMTFIMEGCRLLDEWGRLSERHFLVREDLPREAGVPQHPSLNLPGLAARLDGTLPFAEAVGRGRLLRARATEALLRWIEEGLVEEQYRAPPPAPEPEPQDYAEAMESARTLLRAGRLDAAERALMVAQRMQPQDPVVRQNLRWLQQIRAKKQG